MKRTLVAIVAVFVAWSILDFILHGVLLGSIYARTAELWRPMAEMKMGLTYVVVLIAAACFVYVYAELVSDRSSRGALIYGLVFGIGTGTSMGYGSYAVMPLPYYLALSWFLGTVVETVVGAYVAWFVLKRPAE